MTIDDKIRDNKLQYRGAAKISPLSSSKNDKYKYPKGEEILLSDQIRVIQEADFTYSPRGEAFEKQIKTIEDQQLRQDEALKALKTEKK